MSTGLPAGTPREALEVTGRQMDPTGGRSELADPVGPGTVGASRVTIVFPSCSQSVAAVVTAEVTITKGVFFGSGGSTNPATK